MIRDKFVALVVPAYNEERHITDVLASIPPLVDLVIVVDDGSRDRTADTVQRLSDSRVALLRHAENRGVGAAIVTGYRFALGRGADVVGVIGGDGQMDTRHLPALLEPIVEGRCDFSKGNRFFSWSSWRGMPVHRAVGNVVLSLLTKIASGYWHVFDAQNGYTMISAQILRRLPLSRLETGYQFENLLLIYLSAAGARVTDVPIPARYGEEESGIKLWRDVPAILWTLVRGFVFRTRERYLRSGRSIAGGVLAIGGVLVATGMASLLARSLWPTPSWTWVAARVQLGIGIACVGLFLVLDIVESRRLRGWFATLKTNSPADGDGHRRFSGGGGVDGKESRASR